MKGKICFCPSSILWITKHLKKSAKATFKRMILGQTITRADRVKIRKRFQRSFTQKQLAAQRLFARRAKAGTLRRRRR